MRFPPPARLRPHATPGALLALLLALLPVGAPAQVTGSIAGVAVDAGTGAPLQGVQVTLLAASDSAALRGTTTGSDGSFRLTGVAPGAYRRGVRPAA